MPRIRTTKPEFWSSPGIETISPWARLLFIAMWNWADDAGRGTCQLRELQGFAFPFDEEEDAPEVATMAGFKNTLAQVRDLFGVQFYKVGGRPYYAIPSWKRHQRNERTAQSKYPAPDKGEPWDFLARDQRRGGTSDNLRRGAAEDSGPSAEPGNDPAQTPAKAPEVQARHEGTAPEQNQENDSRSNHETRPEQGSSGTSDNVRPGAAEAPHSSGPGTGEQGNRGTGEQVTTSATQPGADAPSGAPDLFGGTEDAPKPRAKKKDDPFFVEFWDAYPKKTDKDGARRAWSRAIADGTDAREIVAGAQLYGRMWQGATPEELHYAVKSSKWLSDGMWEGSWPMRDMSRAGDNVVQLRPAAGGHVPYAGPTDSSAFHEEW